MTKKNGYPQDVFALVEWAKRKHGVLISIETNTSAHGGTDVKIWIRDRPNYYDQWVEKTQYGMRPHDIERWAKKVEELKSEASA